MNFEEIQWKHLTLNDLRSGLLETFNRYQEVKRVWRTVKGQRCLVAEPFIDQWDLETKKEIVSEDLFYCLKDGGIVNCAQYNGEIIAFSSLLRSLFGSEQQYADLMQLHVSYEYRHRGLGRQLFEKCVKQAELWGARKLYISSHSAEETYAFYSSMGCVDAVEINQHHVELEPFDIQLEYVIGN